MIPRDFQSNGDATIKRLRQAFSRGRAPVTP